jgi:hypothetical protein
MYKANRSTYLPVLFLVIIFIFQFIKASSQNKVPDSLVIERIEYIQNVLNKGKQGANLWWNGWLIGYSAATVGQGVVYLSADEKSTKQDMVVGAATTLLGAAGQLITPMVPVHSPDKLAAVSGDNREERITKLQRAEELLKASALREKSGRSWQTHAIAGVVNISSGLITWIGFKRTVWAGVGNFALNTAITEAQIWTQPTRAMKDWENYCKKYNSNYSQVVLKPDISWYVGVYPGGASIRVVF